MPLFKFLIHNFLIFSTNACQGIYATRPIHNVKKKDGIFFANQVHWNCYLFNTGFLVADALVDAYVHLDNHELLDEHGLLIDKNKASLPKIHAEPTKDDPALVSQLKLLSLIFPEIPFKYFALFPCVKDFVLKLNLSEKKFCEMASSASAPRMQGRPKANLIQDYKTKFPHLSHWFEEIEKEKNKVPKRVI